MENLTPAMRQYMKCKKDNPDCLVLFRMGDFYETFYDDARLASKILEITLTSRGKGEKSAPLAGFPYHALDTFLPKLIKNNIKVAIVEQTQNPKDVVGIVKRDVVRIVTPGTIIENNCLVSSENNYLMAIYVGKHYGISYVDISTGELFCANIDSFEKLKNEIAKLSPAEIIVPSESDKVFLNSLRTNILNGKELYITKTSMFNYFFDNAKETIKDHFQKSGSDSVLTGKPEIISSCGALLSYIKDTQKTSLNYINHINYYELSDFMTIDTSTQRNLELLRNSYDGSKKNTLLSILNKTITAGASREIKRWILRPLISEMKINMRLDAVNQFRNDRIMKDELREIFKNIYDIDRLISKVNFGNANPKDLQMLSNSLKYIPNIKNILNGKNNLLNTLSNFKDVSRVVTLINDSIKNEPSMTIREGNIIAKGINSELDLLHDIKFNGKKKLQEIQAREISFTGIKALKVKYNKIFGYFIEIPRRSSNLVPDNYIKKQTQVNTERFITDELKEFEVKILSAQNKINELEYDIYMQVIDEIKSFTNDIQDIAIKISQLDILSTFCEIADTNNYCMPTINTSNNLTIIDGRHPVIETIEERFIPNDCIINDSQKVMLITGPNMAGKSTYMRQNALIILMAQIGSFVPCSKCEIGITDRIFSRVGASDDLSHGQSTFMVEMNETANILNFATKKSFVIFDEIGRGTSTYDGVAIAWSVAEHIFNVNNSKTLFATHYHVLNKLENHYDGIKNYNISVLEENEKIVFLRKIVRGATDKSYGIHVASLAGVPKAVVNRAIKIQKSLESDDDMNSRVDNYKTEDATREHEEFLSKKTSKKKNKDMCPDQMILGNKWG